ncbi:MAG: HalD/BesD family halogenase [Methyloligellaceae bacterium]
MVADATEGLFDYINLDDYPLHEAGGQKWQRVVDGIKQELSANGCSVLPEFVRGDALELLEKEGINVAPHAYRHLETVNAYNIDSEADLPADHPAKITFEKGNAFVARDLIPNNYIINQLYSSSRFKSFIAECFDMKEIYELADPLAALCLNVLDPGRSHPWHFDKNELTVSMLTKAPGGGGVFEYCPNIRTAENENFDAVRSVIMDHGEEHISRLHLNPGDLQLFKGRFSLHRVTPVTGNTERHTAIFAYTPIPGVVGYPERTRQLFGRVLPEHKAALQNAIKNDALLD